MSKTPVEKIQEHIKCGICLDTVTKPLLCPECSKMFCKQCLQKSFSIDPRCPHCRYTARSIKKFIKCNWVDQLSDDLNSIENISICSKHGEPLSLYCHKCKEVICSHCVLFAQDHEGHEIAPLKELCEMYKSKLNELYTDICNLQALSCHKADMANTVLARSHQQRLYHAKALKSNIDHLLTFLTSSEKSKIETKTSSFEVTIDNLEACQYEIKDFLKTISSPSEFVAGADNFIYRIKSVVTGLEIGEPDEDLVKNLEDELITSSHLNLIPEYTTNVVKLYDFAYLVANRRIVSGSGITFYGIHFKLEVHLYPEKLPPGEIAETQDLQMFLRVKSGYVLPERVIFSVRVDIVNQYGCITRDLSKTILVGVDKEPELKTRFPLTLNMATVHDLGYVNPEVDCLVMRLKVRPVSYQMLSVLQDYHIAELGRNPELRVEARARETTSSPSRGLGATSSSTFPGLSFLNIWNFPENTS